jgi:PAS domain S-box-containing protein
MPPAEVAGTLDRGHPVIDLSGVRQAPAPALHEIVGAQRPEILRRWKERVRRELGEHLPEPELVDSLPALLDQVEKALRTTASSRPADASRAVGSLAGRHGAQRAALGVGIDALVWEYGILRDVILDLVEERGLLPTLDEVRALARVVSDIVADAVSAHAAEGDRRYREATERLRALADHAPVAVLVRDARGRFAFANATAAGLLGRAPDEIVGRTYEEVLSPGLVAYFAPLDARVERGETLEMEDRVPTAQGERVFHIVKFPLRGEPGAIGVIGIDVTDRNSAERRLEQAVEFEKQLVAIVSHDLRTPLGTISLTAGTLLAREDLAEPARRGLSRILSAVEQAARMIRDLLDLGRARLAGGIPIDRRQVDVAPLAARLVDEHRAAWPDREIRLAVTGDTAGRWDPDRVVQALGNLVTNAAKYGARGTPISVALQGSWDALRLSVHNLGDPIPAEVLPTLFHPGARHAANRRDGGLGLGLFIVERIAAAHGGTVSVSSTREAGTTFTVLIPRDGSS